MRFLRNVERSLVLFIIVLSFVAQRYYLFGELGDLHYFRFLFTK